MNRERRLRAVQKCGHVQEQDGAVVTWGDGETETPGFDARIEAWEEDQTF